MIDTENVKKANLFRVIYIGLSFLVLFTAYIAAQNMIAQIYTQLGYGSLGQVCLFLVFGFMGLTSVIASYLKKKLSLKAGLIYGALPHISLIFAGAFTTFCDKYSIEGGFCSSSFIVFLNCVCASCTGIGAAILWLCQAVYVNECAEESTKGLYNGLFWSIFQSAQIVSGLLATLILGSADQFTFYLVLLVFGFVSIIMMSFIKDPIPYNGRKQVEEIQETLSEALATFGQVLTEKKYFVLYHGLIFSGIAIGCYIGFLNIVVTQIVDSTDINVVNSSLGLVLLVLAIGEVSAGLSAGRVADMFDKLKIFNITMLINETALLMTLLALLFKSYSLALICGFLWGYGDTSIQTLINAVIGSIFGGRVELYSAYKFFQGFACMYSCLFCAVLPSKEIPLLYIVFIAGSLLVFHTLYHRYLPAKINKNGEYLLADEKRMMVELEKI